MIAPNILFVLRDSRNSSDCLKEVLMNNKQKLHQIKLQQWDERFRRQASSGLTVKEWCTENNFTIHTYNYWKHLLKQEYVDSALSENHEIVPLSMDCSLPASAQPIQTSPIHLRDSRDSCNTISITIDDIVIHAGSTVSDEHLLRILKAVRHA